MGALRILIGGSHGFIGTALVARLEELGHDVVRIVRRDPGENEIQWTAIANGSASEDLEGFDAVINLAGVSIGEKKWSQKEKGRIWDSRINTTEALCQRLAEVIDRPSVLVNASAVGYYGNGGEEELTEASPKGEGFLSDVAYNWEDATSHAANAGIRVVNLRSGVVLGAHGGALAKQFPLFRLGMAGRLGSGHQYMAWVSLRDEVEAIIFAITSGRLSGPVNVVGPTPVTNLEFTKTFARILRRPAWVPVWPWMLHATFGRQLTDETLLTSQKAVPRKLLKAGFKFQDFTIADALHWAVEEEQRSREEKRAAKRAKRGARPGKRHAPEEHEEQDT